MVLLQPVKQERELLVEPHARARIACDLTNVTNLRWYKDSEVSILYHIILPNWTDDLSTTIVITRRNLLV